MAGLDSHSLTCPRTISVPPPGASLTLHVTHDDHVVLAGWLVRQVVSELRLAWGPLLSWLPCRYYRAFVADAQSHGGWGHGEGGSRQAEAGDCKPQHGGREGDPDR